MSGMQRYSGRNYFKCQYCRFQVVVSDAPHPGKCGACNVKRVRVDDVVKCPTCAKINPRLTEEHRAYHEAMRTAPDTVEAHEQEKHRPDIVFDRIHEIEHSVLTRGTMRVYIPDEQWATHELCIEYRALMREWWTFSNADVTRLLYGKPNSEPTHGGAVNVVFNRKNRLNRLVKQCTLNEVTGWYELPGTLFRFYLNDDEKEKQRNGHDLRCR